MDLHDDFFFLSLRAGIAYLLYSRYLASTAAIYEVSFSMFSEWDFIIYEGFAAVDPSLYSPHPASFKSAFPNDVIALED